MTVKHTSAVKEPLIHLSKRSDIHPLHAWAIRLIAVVLGLVVCGLVAFMLIEKLQAKPEKNLGFLLRFHQGLL